MGKPKFAGNLSNNKELGLNLFRKVLQKKKGRPTAAFQRLGNHRTGMECRGLLGKESQTSTTQANDFAVFVDVRAGAIEWA